MKAFKYIIAALGFTMIGSTAVIVYNHINQPVERTSVVSSSEPSQATTSSDFSQEASQSNSSESVQQSSDNSNTSQPEAPMPAYKLPTFEEFGGHNDIRIVDMKNMVWLKQSNLTYDEKRHQIVVWGLNYARNEYPIRVSSRDQKTIVGYLYRNGTVALPFLAEGQK